MTINKEITRLEKSSVKLTITIAKDDVQSGYDELLTDYAKKVQIPGFRKGKVPKNVLERKFGDGLKEEALGRIAEKALGELFEDETFPKESKPLPYSTPRFEDEEKLVFKLDADLVFSVIYDVLPKVNVEKWQGYEVTVPDVAVTDEEIGAELEAVRERNSIVMDKAEGESAATGDVATVNFCELNDEGGVVTGTEREDFAFTLGSGHNVYKIDDDAIGMKKGETKEINKKYPDDFEDSELAGKTIKLRITLTALKSKKLPELDDDLAQDVSDKFNTLEELKQDIREKLNQNLEQRMKSQKTSAILEKIMEATPVEIPESMTKLELDSRFKNFARQFNTDAQGLYKMLGHNPDSMKELLDRWTPDANKALHSRLIVETLMENLKLEASDEEAESMIVTQATESGMPVEDVRKYYEGERMMDYLKEEIKERKLFDRLLAENTIKPGEKVKFADFIGKNG